jgi:hypothetical protein
MTNKRQLRGVELRYALTMYLFQHGPQTVADLIEALEYQRGRYGPGEMPRGTEHRIHQRVLSLRYEAAAIASQNDDAYWNALLA